MELNEAIRHRRSIGKVKPDPVEKEKVQSMLEAATWAPNHRRTQPWRFFVMTGDGRKRLGRAYAEIAKTGMEEPLSEEEVLLLAKQEAKAFRAPVVIAVAASPSDLPGVVRVEELAAVHAAVQNMLLTAHDLGLAAIWRTGEPAYHPLMKRAFGLADSDEMTGFLYVGYPDSTPPSGSRAPFQDRTVWLEENL